MMKTCHIVSLGCPKNLVDTEVMLGQLEKAGYAVVEHPEQASLILVNTCGFIQSAVEEAIETILELSAIKQQGKGIKLVVTGCMVQRYGGDLQQELPEVDLFVGTEGFHDIALAIAQIDAADKQPPFVRRQPQYILDSHTPRRISTPNHWAYVKVTEGCLNRCSYCLIPSLRGNLRSRTSDDIVLEMQRLEASGAKEMTLIAQDLTAYGLDLGREGERLIGLLEKILAQTRFPWLRLLYLYPSRVDAALLKFMAAEPRIVPYVETPLQHVNDRILKAMNRPYGRKEVEALIERIRKHLPGCAIRTTMMVGFPGETEAEFLQIKDFLERYRLNHVGVFAYSNEEGSPSSSLPDHCTEAVKEERREQLLACQADISTEINSKFIGQVLDVLVDGASKETDLLLEGRSKYQAPDIDGCVYINSGSCEAGDIVPVRITESHVYDLVGEIITPGF